MFTDQLFSSIIFEFSLTDSCEKLLSVTAVDVHIPIVQIRKRYGRYSSSPFHAVQETQERKTTPSDVDGDGVNNEEEDRPRNNNKASNTTGIIVAVSVGVVVVAFAAVLVVIVYKKKLDKLKAEMPSQASYV